MQDGENFHNDPLVNQLLRQYFTDARVNSHFKATSPLRSPDNTSLRLLDLEFPEGQCQLSKAGICDRSEGQIPADSLLSAIENMVLRL